MRMVRHMLAAALAAGFLSGSGTHLAVAAALDGDSHAIVAPTFNSSTATMSYLRLFNGGVGTATFTVTIVGDVTGKTYGTAAIQIPQYTSPQYGMATLLTLAHAGSPADGDTGFTFYLQSTEPWAGYQHVTFNPATALFGNSSVCKSTVNEVHGNHGLAILTNVHTSLLASYPSTLYIHNPNPAPVTYNLQVIDAGAADPATGILDATAGNYIGGIAITIGANATYTRPFSAIETSIGWRPADAQYHANVLIYDPGNTHRPPAVAQAIANRALGGQIDMSLACAVTPAAQVQSSLAAQGLTRYCGTKGANGVLDAFLAQVTASGALTAGYYLIPSTFPISPPSSDYRAVIGQVTTQATGTEVDGVVTAYSGHFSGRIQSGTLSGTGVVKFGSFTVNATTCY